MAQDSRLSFGPLPTSFHPDAGFYYRITGRDGEPRPTRIHVTPENRVPVHNWYTATKAQFEKMGCAEVLSPQSGWGNAIVRWGQYYRANAGRIPRWMGNVQEWLWFIAGGSTLVFAAAAVVRHSSLSQDHDGLRQFLDRPLQYAADGISIAIGVAALSHGVEWLFNQPYFKLKKCEELQNRMAELQDVEAAIAAGQVPELVEEPSYLSRSVSTAPQPPTVKFPRVTPAKGDYLPQAALPREIEETPWWNEALAILGGIATLVILRGLPIRTTAPAGFSGGLDPQPDNFEYSRAQNIF